MSAGNGKAVTGPVRDRLGRLTGGNPGNKGGGRPPSEIRQRCRGSFYDRIRILEEIADGTLPLTRKCTKCGHTPKKQEEEDASPPAAADRIRAIDLLGHYGLEVDKGVSAADVRQRLGRTIDIIRETLEPAQAIELLDALRPVWA